MGNILSKKFTVMSLLKFTAPTIVMMVFMSMYTMVDGIFVSNYVGTGALSAVNIVYPALNIIIAVGIMLATGGSAVIAKKMGEEKLQEAKENFTLIVAIGIAIGLVIGAVGFLFIEQILIVLGASSSVYTFCYDYMLMLVWFSPFGILQMLFQYFFVTAGKPSIGLIATVIGGVANIVLDYVFIVPMDMGIAGAALATGIGFSVPGLFGLWYFATHKKGSLCFVKPKFDGKVLWDSCTNGSSEMVTNLSIAVTTLLFNIVMMKTLGEDGVAAITIVLYAQYFLMAVYLGYTSGVAPVLSYNYGNGNTTELKKLFKISVLFLGVVSIMVYINAMLLSNYIVSVFAKPDSNVFAIAQNGFVLFAFCFLFMWFNIFASGLFTALSNGKVSAIISFLRTFVFIVAGVLLMPRVWGVNGVWLAIPVAEALTMIISLAYIIKLRKVYHYL